MGRVRRKLAELLSRETGWVVEAHKIGRTNPINQHFEDCCAWDVWCDVPNQTWKGHIYSWDRMTDCVRLGIITDDKEQWDIEVMAHAQKKDLVKLKAIA